MTALAPAGAVSITPTAPGPLDGVRVAVKDLYDIADAVTAAGNPTLAAGPVATTHAAAVAALLGAGAHVVAKTATDELAMGMFGVNSHYGTPPNPAAPDRVPGGSSSGSASMVAAGDADLGLGTDTGGSIRVPAAFCGLAGLRPSHGRVDLTGVRPMAPRFDTAGLLARDLTVLARAFDVLTEPVAVRPVSELVLFTDLVARADPEVAERTRDTAARWAEELGIPVRGASLADGADLVAIFWPLMSRQLWDSNGPWLTREDPQLGTGIGERIRMAGTISADAAMEAGEQLRQWIIHVRAVLGDGIGILPTTCAGAPLRTGTHAELMAYRDRNLAFVVPASLLGGPQLTLPQGTVSEHHTAAPVGVSLLGLPGDDELLLNLGATR